MPNFSATSRFNDQTLTFTADDKDHAWRLLAEKLTQLGEHVIVKDWRIVGLDDPVDVALEAARQRHTVDAAISQATLETLQQAFGAAVDQAFLVYDPADAPDLIFVEDLQQALSAYLPVSAARRLEHRTGGELLSDPVISYLQIMLVTLSTTVATGFLTKIGEDIWDRLKTKALAAARRDLVDDKKRAQKKIRLEYNFDHHALGVTLVIKAGNTFIEGVADVKDYEGLLAALATAGDMSRDVEQRLAPGLDALRQGPRYHMYTGITKSNELFEYGLWFEYYYSTRDPRWQLLRIADYTPAHPG